MSDVVSVRGLHFSQKKFERSFYSLAKYSSSLSVNFSRALSVHLHLVSSSRVSCRVKVYIYTYTSEREYTIVIFLIYFECECKGGDQCCFVRLCDGLGGTVLTSWCFQTWCITFPLLIMYVFDCWFTCYSQLLPFYFEFRSYVLRLIVAR